MPPGYPHASRPGIASLTPTVCDLMAVPRPGLSSCDPLAGVIGGRDDAGISRIERCLVYAPDAVGAHVFELHPGLVDEMRKAAPVAEYLRSAFPPKTPVCFASMFTGAEPEAHGITAYERPVLKCDTLFDALIRAGRRPAIVSVKDASADVIFRGRDMDYFSEPYDGGVTGRVLDLLAAGEHDFILAYHQEYDDLLHKFSTFSPEALAAAGRHVNAFIEMAERARECWAGRSGAFVFAPDHGAHDDPGTGAGTHGDDIPSDMEVIHFCGLLG